MVCCALSGEPAHCHYKARTTVCYPLQQLALFNIQQYSTIFFKCQQQFSVSDKNLLDSRRSPPKKNPAAAFFRSTDSPSPNSPLDSPAQYMQALYERSLPLSKKITVPSLAGRIRRINPRKPCYFKSLIPGAGAVCLDACCCQRTEQSAILPRKPPLTA